MRNVFLALVFFMVVSFHTLAFGSQVIRFTTHEAKINGSIKYSVVGKYIANFKELDGQVTLDKNDSTIEAVTLNIQAQSIKSNCSWCDNIVRSPQVLDTVRFPSIYFQSNKVYRDANGYHVNGELRMHGVRKQMTSPFKVIHHKDKANIILQGQWVINRKDFNIVWNKLLDHGGVVVGNYITVDWVINLKTD